MRETIIKAAAKRFAKYGFYKTTIEEIAYDLNKVKSSLYYYFKTKEELFKAVIESALQKLWASIDSSIASCKTNKEKLFALITSHLQSFGKITEGYDSILDLYFLEHAIVQKVRKKYDEKETAILSELIRAGNESREFNVKDIKNTAIVIMTAIKGAEQEYVEKKHLKNIKTISEVMANMFVKSISKENK